MNWFKTSFDEYISNTLIYCVCCFTDCHPPAYTATKNRNNRVHLQPENSYEPPSRYFDRQPPRYSEEQPLGYPDELPLRYSHEPPPRYFDRQPPSYSLERPLGYPDDLPPRYSDEPPPSYSLVFDTRSNAHSHDYTEQRGEQSRNGRISAISGRYVTEQTPTESDQHEDNAGSLERHTFIFSTDPQCQVRQTGHTCIPPHNPVSQTRRYLPIISEVNTDFAEQCIIPLPTDPDNQVTHTVVNTSSTEALQGLNRQQRTDTDNNTQLPVSNDTTDPEFKCTSIRLICFAFGACLICLITGILALYFVWRRHKFLSAGQNKEALKSESVAVILIIVNFIIIPVCCIVVLCLTGNYILLIYIMIPSFCFFLCCCSLCSFLLDCCQKLTLKTDSYNMMRYSL